MVCMEIRDLALRLLLHNNDLLVKGLYLLWLLLLLWCMQALWLVKSLTLRACDF